MRTATLILASLVLAVTAPARGEEPVSLEKAAAVLQAATVTVRIIPAPPAAAPAGGGESGGKGASEPAEATSETAVTKVVVCSGVSLGEGLIVTHADVSAARIRLTLPGGGQSQAKVRVLDQYSGLALLEAEERSLPGLKIAAAPPAVGGWLLSAAAWGAEKPVVSLGVLGAAERSLPAATYPPLLQCDLRTADTSSGAALVNPLGELVGIVVATDASRERQGWVYAVPASHVQRLLRVRAEAKDDKLIVLARLRPVVGLILTAGERPETVFVQRVEKGGPADKAGIREGDQVLAADEHTIRSVYEAERPVLQKQPGDRFVLRVRHDDAVRDVAITLGGGRELPANLAQNRSLVRPTLDIESLAPGQYIARSPQGNVRELSLPAAAGGAEEAGKRALSPEAQVQLLEKALDRYRSALQLMQDELARRDQDQTRSAQQLRSLTAEIESLKRQLDAARAVPAK